MDFDFPSVGMAVLGGDYSGMLSIIMGALVFILFIGVALYIYASLALMAIAKKRDILTQELYGYHLEV